MAKAVPIRAIDGLRGIAALGIVLYHTRASLGYAPELRWGEGQFWKYYLLLDLFFVVSGYAIASGYGAKFEQPFTARDYGRFLWGRFARIYPLYLFVLLVLGAQEMWYWTQQFMGEPVPWPPWGRDSATLPTYIASLFMVQSWGFTNKLVWNIPAWYVSALICAYLAFPFIARGAAGLPKAARPFVLIGIAGIAALALHSSFAGGAFRLPNDMSPARAILEFSVGYGIALLPRGPAWRKWLQLPVLVAVGFGLHRFWPDTVTLSLMVLFFWSLLDDRGLVATPLASRPMVWLGSVSFAVFLIHQPMLSWIDALGQSSLKTWVYIFWEQYFSWNVLMRFVVIVAVAWVANRYIAEPGRRWLEPGRAKPPVLPRLHGDASLPAEGEQSR
jgi:peptidoglycan/LPS O-acetylase OafA/YrhL